MEVKKKLLDIVRDKIHFKHYSIKTEKSYVGWIKHYIFYHNKKHPIEMGKPEIEAFLTHLAVERKVSPATQNQAFSALFFLYKEVLEIAMSSWNIQALRAQERKHIPQVLTKTEVFICLMHWKENTPMQSLKPNGSFYFQCDLLPKILDLKKGRVISPLDM
jgi:site-specific recombinase XerD